MFVDSRNLLLDLLEDLTSCRFCKWELNHEAEEHQTHGAMLIKRGLERLRIQERSSAQTVAASLPCSSCRHCRNQFGGSVAYLSGLRIRLMLSSKQIAAKVKDGTGSLQVVCAHFARKSECDLLSHEEFTPRLRIHPGQIEPCLGMPRSRNETKSTTIVAMMV